MFTHPASTRLYLTKLVKGSSWQGMIITSAELWIQGEIATATVLSSWVVLVTKQD